MSGLRVGVLGAGGQVGLAVLRGLCEDGGISAVGICRNRVSSLRVASHGLKVRTTQTDDAKSLAESTRDLDALVNCALPQYGPSKTSLANRRLANALATACAKRHLVHLSSVAVYGDFISSEPTLFRSPRPDTAYGRQKLEMETLLRKFARSQRANCTILRVGHVYGPELRWSETILSLINDTHFHLPFDGRRPSNAIAISNLIEAVREVLLASDADATFNLTDSPQTPWRELFDMHARASSTKFVRALRSSDSEAMAEQYRKWSQTGLFSRWVRESARWFLQLPGSYLTAVPSIKAFAQRAIATFGSENLDARLWALYCRHLAPHTNPCPFSNIHPLFFSDAVPGPHLEYHPAHPAKITSGLSDWYSVAFTPPERSRA